ncbi:MAG: hypothetical protein SPL19_03590 [Fibrobacter sp.]|nr:hypothetical protein [Fibrobacter sp.]MDY6368485.1 hypothetical protein [Fibrobacter sp.]MDY6389425.1 hypothetical protein [Fibrobacter sp.]
MIAKNRQASSGVYIRILAEKRWIFGAVAHFPAKNRFLRLSFDIKRVNWNRLMGGKAVFFKKMIER